MLEQLKKQVCEANRALVRHELVVLTWGNVSGIDRDSGLVVIKPSGVAYDALTPDKMVAVDLEGKVVAGDYRPSSDTPTHLLLYRTWPDIGSVVHAHSTFATAFAQACRPIPCLGTTHADLFYGEVPVTRALTEEEVKAGYEINTGRVIVERFAKLDRSHAPGVLVANHGPFVWARDPAGAVENATALEEVAKMAFATVQLDPKVGPIPQYILDKHFSRKHGPGAYYGQ